MRLVEKNDITLIHYYYFYRYEETSCITQMNLLENYLKNSPKKLTSIKHQIKFS